MEDRQYPGCLRRAVCANYEMSWTSCAILGKQFRLQTVPDRRERERISKTSAGDELTDLSVCRVFRFVFRFGFVFDFRLNWFATTQTHSNFYASGRMFRKTAKLGRLSFWPLSLPSQAPFKPYNGSMRECFNLVCLIVFKGDVVAQWIRNRTVPGSNPEADT